MNSEKFEEFRKYLAKINDPLNMTHADLEKLLLRQREIVIDHFEQSYNKLSMLHSEAMEELRVRNDAFVIRDSKHYNWLCNKWEEGKFLDMTEGFTCKEDLDDYIDQKIFDEMIEGDQDE